MKDILFVQAGIKYLDDIYRLNMNTATFTNTITHTTVTYFGIRLRNNESRTDSRASSHNLASNDTKSQRIPFALSTYIDIFNNESVGYLGIDYWKSIDMQKYRLRVSDDLRKYQLYDTTTNTLVHTITVVNGFILYSITAPIEYIFAISKLTAHYNVQVEVTYINTTYSRIEYGL